MLQFEEYKFALGSLKPQLDDLGEALGLERARNEVKELEAQAAEAGFWDDAENSQKDVYKRQLPLLPGSRNRGSLWISMIGKQEYDVAVIGGGPGGYTAALYCARSGYSVLVLEKLAPGGQMATTALIDNYPGFENGVDGFELGEKMQKGAERFGAETVFAEVQGCLLYTSRCV